MRVHVDQSLCQGSGYCTQIAPDVFVMVGQRAQVRDEDPTDDEIRRAAFEAESVCPAGAITL